MTNKVVFLHPIYIYSNINIKDIIYHEYFYIILTFVSIYKYIHYVLYINEEVESRDITSEILIHFCRSSITIIIEVEDITTGKSMK